MFKVICYLEIYTHIIRLFRNLYIHGNGKSIEKRGNHKKKFSRFCPVGGGRVSGMCFWRSPWGVSRVLVTSIVTTESLYRDKVDNVY